MNFSERISQAIIVAASFIPNHFEEGWDEQDVLYNRLPTLRNEKFNLQILCVKHFINNLQSRNVDKQTLDFIFYFLPLLLNDITI